MLKIQTHPNFHILILGQDLVRSFICKQEKLLIEYQWVILMFHFRVHLGIIDMTVVLKIQRESHF